jgi:hypothetical protein
VIPLHTMTLSAQQIHKSLEYSIQKLLNQEDLWEKARLHNPWFTHNNIRFALNAYHHSLDTFSEWLQREQIDHIIPPTGRTLGIIAAGNLPLVGLHDCLCGWITGYNVHLKTSAQDSILLPLVLEYMQEYYPELSSFVHITDDFLKDADLYIATGNNNSSRYFSYYFRNKPHLIRKNRNSLAVIYEDYTVDELKRLSHDLFVYFGMGCRNVCRLFLPRPFSFDDFFQAIEGFSDCIHHHKYANNYTYHKALLLMNLDQHLDNGFVLLKENDALYAPVSMIHYSFYDHPEAYQTFIKNHKEHIQCVVGRESHHTPYGQTQSPMWWDYSDGVNTVQFLKGAFP